MPAKSLNEEMKKYLMANQTKSMVSELNRRYHLSAATQKIGHVLHYHFNYHQPSFVISKTTPQVINRLGIRCCQTPYLLTLLNYHRPVNQFIFGRLFSYQHSQILIDFLNAKRLAREQVMLLLTKVDQINRRSTPDFRLMIDQNQVIVARRFSAGNFTMAAIHLLEDRFAIQRGRTILDDGNLHILLN